MNILVTGGTGLIGSHVTRNLITQHGDKVLVLDRLGPPTDDRILQGLAGDVEYTTGTVADLSLILRLIKDYQISHVVHMAALIATSAAQRPLEALEVNIMGTANILEASRLEGLERVVCLSSSSVMGDPDDLVTPRREGDIVLPATGIYPLSKLTCEQLAHTYRVAYGVDTTSIRPRTVYGPGTARFDHTLPVQWITHAAARGESTCRSAGRDTAYDLTYVKDAAAGIIQALKSPGPLRSHVYNVSFGQNVTLGAVADLLNEVCPDTRTELGPGEWNDAPPASNGEQQPPQMRPPQDITLAGEDFGYRPRWPIERAIPDFVRALQEGDYGES